jgi:hypothetical protein
MIVSCSGGRGRKACDCNLCHPSGVSSMKGSPLLWSGHVEN